MSIRNGWCDKAVFVDGSQPEWRDHLRGVGPPERLCSAYAWLRAATGKTVSLPSLVIVRSRYMGTFAWVLIASIGLRLLCLEVRSSRAACAPFLRRQQKVYALAVGEGTHDSRCLRKPPFASRLLLPASFFSSIRALLSSTIFACCLEREDTLAHRYAGWIESVMSGGASGCAECPCRP